MEVGLGTGHIVRWGPRSLHQKQAQQLPHSLANVYHGQTVGWIKTPLGTEVGLSPGHIVLDGDPAAPHGYGHSSPHFLAHVSCGQTVAHLSNC